ncbi:MAG TPA: MBL fold metallo-hydrolase [Gemmatimonadaceae bacterium]|nr:MBL fold metallo-hydrolase [Gemmatimonadaceae bacterium]
MKLWMLGSGSSGNAIVVECQGSRILIDCGFGTRTLAGRLKSIGVEPGSIEGCLVTHEHSDHVKGAGAAAKKWGWGVFATPGTAKAPELAETPVHLFDPGMTIEFDHMTVTSTATPHDATQSVGFVVESRSTGARAGLFYDIGHVSTAIADACQRLDILVLESNHDVDMLRNGPYARWLQMRIASRTGHLSNRDAGLFAREAVTREMNHLVLAHLSENCNTTDVAVESMRGALGRTRFKGAVTAAQQDAVVGPFTPGAARAEAAVQYALF